MPKKSVKKVVKKAVAPKVAKKAVTKKAATKAGRPKGTGKYGCETKAVRIPLHLEGEVQRFVMNKVKAEGKK